MVCQSSISQSELDSLSSIWKNDKLTDDIRFKSINDYYKSQSFAHPDSLLALTEFHHDLAVQRFSEKEKASALNEKSYIYYLKGDTKTSLQMLNQSIAILERLDNPIRLATVYSNLGAIYGEENKYQEAIRCFSKTLKIFQEEGIKTGEARMLNNMGLIYYYLDSYDLALEYFNKSLAIEIDLNREPNTGTIISNIGSVYLKQDKNEPALEKGLESIEILMASNNLSALSNAYFLIAKSYEKLGRIEEARLFVSKCHKIDHEINNNSRTIERKTFEANLDLNTNPELALEKAEAVLELVENNTEHELKTNIYLLLYKCYKLQNRFDLSLTMHEKFAMYNDSLQIEKNNMAIIEEAIQREFDEKLVESNIVNQIKEANLKLKHTHRIYWIVFGSIAFIGVLVVYFRFKIRKNSKQKDKLLSEIESLKHASTTNPLIPSNLFQLDRQKIEREINRKMNETDWAVLNVLLEDPVIPNKEIAEKVFKSLDGVGSSLRRMYEYFEVKESRYKKISLLMEAVKLSK